MEELRKTLDEMTISLDKMNHYIDTYRYHPDKRFQEKLRKSERIICNALNEMYLEIEALYPQLPSKASRRSL